MLSLLSLSLLSPCLCVQSTSLNQFVSTMSLSMSTKFVLVAFENNGNGLDGFRVHLVALRCDDMTSVQSVEMSLHIAEEAGITNIRLAISDNSGYF